MLRVALAFIVLCLLPANAHAERRVALFDADNQIVMTETYVNGVTGSAILKPIWQLVTAERATKR